MATLVTAVRTVRKDRPYHYTMLAKHRTANHSNIHPYCLPRMPTQHIVYEATLTAFLLGKFTRAAQNYLGDVRSKPLQLCVTHEYHHACRWKQFVRAKLWRTCPHRSSSVQILLRTKKRSTNDTFPAFPPSPQRWHRPLCPGLPLRDPWQQRHPCPSHKRLERWLPDCIWLSLL